MKFTFSIGENLKFVEELIERLNKENIINRIWQKDYKVWSNDPAEISNRLGWLDSIEVTGKNLNEIVTFVDEVKKAGYTNALLMGMGGSSLAPEVFRFTFGVKEGYLDLTVLDSTHPQVVMNYANKFNPGTTLY
ncbi:MAG TPA: hypothetical protein VF270_00400, partial [Ignavibacteriaceae bacterium]